MCSRYTLLMGEVCVHTTPDGGRVCVCTIHDEWGRCVFTQPMNKGGVCSHYT